MAVNVLRYVIIQIDLSKCEKFHPTIGVGLKVHNKVFWLLLIYGSLGLIFFINVSNTSFVIHCLGPPTIFRWHLETR